MDPREARPGLIAPPGAGGGRPAVLLDRDGVLNRLVARSGDGRGEAPLGPSEVELIPGAAAAVARLRAAGYGTAIVTNQPAAAKGETTLAQVEAVQAEVLRRLAGQGASVDCVQMCLHHPDGPAGHPPGAPCGCRKPAPGMLRAALAEMAADPGSSWMVGDSDTDTEAGRAAGVRTILVDSAGGAHRRTGRAAPDARVPDLAAAVDLILSERVAVRAPKPPTTI